MKKMIGKQQKIKDKKFIIGRKLYFTDFTWYKNYSIKTKIKKKNH